MVTLKKFDLSGKEVGDVTVDDAFLEVSANNQMIKDYIVAIRANARQWSASTKGRSEVSHSNQKPHRQKGTGNARQGSLAAPQYRGGGIVFGPKPKKNQHVRINQKERALAVRFLFAEKVKEGQLIVLEDSAVTLDKPQTKATFSFLKGRELAGRRILFVSESASEEVETEGKKLRVSLSSDKHKNFKLSLRNLPRCLYRIADAINGQDIALAKAVVITESALAQVQERLA